MARMREGRTALLASLRGGAHVRGAAGATPAAHAAVAAHMRQTLVEELQRSQAAGARWVWHALASPTTACDADTLPALSRRLATHHALARVRRR
jgi:hypothetical protein